LHEEWGFQLWVLLGRQDYDPWFTKDKEIHPLGNVHEPKRRFQPSKWEKMKILKIMKRIQMGTYKVGALN